MVNTQLPNIILIIMDSARSDCFGCYGSTENLTPNIDALAKNSVVCDNFYAAGPSSALSHVAIFSGQHSTRNGIVHNLSEIRQPIPSITEILSRKKEYKAFGMAKIIQPPVGYEDLFGFEELVYPQTNRSEKGNVPLIKRIIDQLRKYPRLWTMIKYCFSKTFGTRILLKQSAKHFDGKSSLDYLYNRLISNQGPVFLYSTILHPHTPYCPPSWAVRKVFGDRKVNPLAYEIQTDLHKWVNGDYGPVTDAIEDMRSLYKAELYYGDYLVGEFLERLKESGNFDTSIIIITGDHGEMFGEFGELNHGGGVYNEVIKVPCIIKFPNNCKKQNITKLCSHYDILPTILNYLDVSLQNEKVVDGEDMFIHNPDRFLVIDAPPIVLPGRMSHYPNVVKKHSVFWRSLIDPNYKFVWRSDNYTGLFRRQDIEIEKNNLISQKNKKAKLMFKKMMNYYHSLNKEFNINEYPINIGPKAAQFMTSPRIIRELKKEGYL